jgi:hypothetical protein
MKMRININKVNIFLIFFIIKIIINRFILLSTSKVRKIFPAASNSNEINIYLFFKYLLIIMNFSFNPFYKLFFIIFLIFWPCNISLFQTENFILFFLTVFLILLIKLSILYNSNYSLLQTINFNLLFIFYCFFFLFYFYFYFK